MLEEKKLINPKQYEDVNQTENLIEDLAKLDLSKLNLTHQGGVPGIGGL
jgi:hypothetical protein